MFAEKEFFLQILSDHLAQNQTVPRVDIDWEALNNIAHAHQVKGIVYYQCRDFIPQPFRADFEKAYCAEVFIYKNREKSYEAIDEQLTAAGIQHFTIKGFEVASCYPVPSLRTMGDLDIIVSKEDKANAGKILESLGFMQSGDHAPDYDWCYIQNGLHYELHRKRII